MKSGRQKITLEWAMEETFGTKVKRSELLKNWTLRARESCFVVFVYPK